MFEISLRILEHCFAKVLLSSRRGRSLARGTNVSNFVRAFHILSPTKKRLEADADQDGKIYYHEFIRWICQELHEFVHVVVAFNIDSTMFPPFFFQLTASDVPFADVYDINV